MTDKKELNDKELEKASGGIGPDEFQLKGKISSFTMESYDEIEEECFYIDTNVISETSTIVYTHAGLSLFYGYAPFFVNGDNVYISPAWLLYMEPLNNESEFKLEYPYKITLNK